MKTRSIICALAAAGLQFAATAYAQGNFNVENNTVPQEWTNRAKEGAPAQTQAEVDYRDRQAAIRSPRPADRRDWRSRNPQPDYSRGDRPGPVGQQPGYRVGSTPADGVYHPGGRVPPVQRGYGYVVEDWRGHRLSAPPRGFQWVQSGADYLLVNARTGTVSRVVRGR